MYKRQQRFFFSLLFDIPAPLAFDRGAFVINDVIPTAVIELIAVVFAFRKRVKTPDNIIWVVDIVYLLYTSVNLSQGNISDF